MADPLSISASILAVAVATIKSAKLLSETVEHYKERDKTLARLQNELEDLLSVLDSLQAASSNDAAILDLLKGPVSRCSQECHGFEEAMRAFASRSKMGLRDWAKMEFRKDDIYGFMDTLAGYKSTIAVGLGVITMQHSKSSRIVLEQYHEMVMDTTYNLQVHLQRIDDRLSKTIPTDPLGSVLNVDLEDERTVTAQCLRICEDAKSYLENLQARQSSLLPDLPDNNAEIMRKRFDAELITSQALAENREKIAETTTHLQKQLAQLSLSDAPANDRQRAQLQEDISISKQCLEICKEAANQVSFKKVHLVGEVIADDDTDQVVVTTLAISLTSGRC